MRSDPWQNPYLTGDYAPVRREIGVERLAQVKGESLCGLNGTYVRNGPNPRYPGAPKTHHWFDGDGMLHAARFSPDGAVTYRNGYIQTDDFRAEQSAERALWGGLLASRLGYPEDRYKDTANTDVIAHRGRLWTMHYMCGKPVAVDPMTLETLGAERLVPDQPDLGRPLRISAHCKVDPATGELVFFDYAARKPYMTYGSIDAEGGLQWWHPVELPGPRLPHDMALTRRFAVLMDLPVVHAPQAEELGRWMVDYRRAQPARFGLAPRTPEAGPVRWFEASPCYIYHSVNAWESDDGRRVTLIAYKSNDPIGRPRAEDGSPLQAAAMANLRLAATLHEWVFDLETGRTRERPLSDLNAEFPIMDARRIGQPNRHLFAMTIPKQAQTLRFDGLVTHDLETGRQNTYRCPPHRYLSEVAFAPRPGGTEDNDGWLVTFAAGGDAPSELQVFSASDISLGPVASWHVPQRIPLGFHATWSPGGPRQESRCP